MANDRDGMRFLRGVPAPAAVFAVLILALAASLPATATGAEAPGRPAVQLIMFFEPGCPYCEAWDQAVGVVFPKTREGRILALRRVDLSDRPLPDDVAGLGPVAFTPTFIVVYGGREVGRIVGYPGEDFFWWLLGEIIAKLPDEARPATEQPATEQPKTDNR